MGRYRLESKNFGNFKNILIVGMGLIGGSFGISLKNEGFKGKIYGLDLKETRIKTAIEKGAIDFGYTDVSKVPWDKIDLVVLASPVKTFKSIAKQIKPYLNKSTVITDVGSVKGDLVKELENLLKPFVFIGGHPIAGTEKEGVENSVVGLFKGKRYIITTDYPENDINVIRLKKLWEDLGSKVEFMNPDIHDYIFGAISHLPHAVAYSLVHTIIALSKEKNINLFKYTGAGFRDFTRIAASSPIIWKDIFLENKENLVNAIDEYIKSLQDLKDLIQKEDEDKLVEYIAESRDKRLLLDE